MAGSFPRHRLYAPDARSHCPFGDDCHQADFTRPPDMRAAAEFDRENFLGLGFAAPHGYDAHLIPVFLTEQSAGPCADGIIDAHQTGCDGFVLQDNAIGHGFNRFKLRVINGLGVRKVKAQAIG